RLEALADAMPNAEPIVVESDGTRPVVVRRTDIPSTDDPRAKRLGVAANVIAHMDYAPDGGILALIAADDDAVARLIRQDDVSVAAMVAETPPDFQEASIDTINSQWSVLVECVDEQEQTKLLERFIKDGLKCKALIS
ncbi:MAG TPA: hypothetical protein VII92_05415, partial [Anaerolineae bacterium]